MGRSQRNKGLRGEYAVRDHFRSLGWSADRVPSSGAAQGADFKGDITLAKNGSKLTAEVKFRKEEYTTVYALVDTLKSPICLVHEGVYVTASYDFKDLGFDGNAGIQFRTAESKTPGLKKLIGLKKLVKTCDFLVIKDNHKPLLFVRFW